MVSPIRSVSRCTRCRAEIERGDLCCAVCGLATPHDPNDLEHVQLTLVRCTGCNAAVRYDVEVEAAKCAFCGEQVAVEQVEDPPEQVQEVVPFDVNEGAARRGVLAWMKTRDGFTPGDLAEKAEVASIRPLWWAAWVCDAVAEVTFTADTTHGARRAPWAPYAGRTTLRFQRLLLSASQGLSQKETDFLSPAYELRKTVAPGEVEQRAAVESFQIERSAARAQIAARIEQVARAQLTGDAIPGTSHRNVKLSILLSGLKTRRVALPAWVLAYRYRDRLYRVVLHGQDEGVVDGTSPTSWWKVCLVLGLAGAGAAGLLYLAFLFLER